MPVPPWKMSSSILFKSHLDDTANAAEMFKENNEKDGGGEHLQKFLNGPAKVLRCPEVRRKRETNNIVILGVAVYKIKAQGHGIKDEGEDNFGPGGLGLDVTPEEDGHEKPHGPKQGPQRDVPVVARIPLKVGQERMGRTPISKDFNTISNVLMKLGRIIERDEGEERRQKRPAEDSPAGLRGHAGFQTNEPQDGCCDQGLCACKPRRDIGLQGDVHEPANGLEVDQTRKADESVQGQKHDLGRKAGDEHASDEFS